MQNFTQDRLIQSENLTEFNIAYPIYITGWEVRQVQDINKLYARVFYKKSVRGAKAAKVKLTCISEFGEIIQEEIKSINDIDKKPYDFFEIYPLHNDTRKIEICVTQGVCSNGESVTDVPSVIVSNTFVPFNREIEYAAGQKIIASAKGYPQENESCWICCCGAINAKNSERCVVCKFSKTTVFEKITEENIKEKAAAISDERKAKKEQEAQEQEAQRIKRKKRNKLIAILSGCCAIAIILFCSLYFPLAPLETVEQDGMTFQRVNDDGSVRYDKSFVPSITEFEGQKGYVVVKYVGNENSISVPAKVRGLPVIGIMNDAFQDYSNLVDIELPDSLLYISNSAFEGCKNLRAINLPNKITSIYSGTFSDCKSLESVSIPDSVVNIYGANNYGEGAFANCTRIKEIIIPVSVVNLGEGVFSGWGAHQTICFETSREISIWKNWDKDCYAKTIYAYENITINRNYDYVIHNGSALLTKYKSDSTDVLIPKTIDGYNVVSIGTTFINNDEITTITIQDNLPVILDYSFFSCENLNNVNLPNNLRQIKNSAFRTCSKLETITIPDNVICIGTHAFAYCNSLKEIILSENLIEIESFAFSNCLNLKRIVIPKSVEFVGYDIFYFCPNLTIYVEVDKKPSGWSASWNSDDCLVVWGYKGD